jgi:hypothetical protein
MLRIIFHNPHLLWYKLTIGQLIEKRKANDKYEYLVDHFYRENKLVYVYIEDETALLLVYSLLKFISWVLINHLNPLRFRIIVNHKKLLCSDALLIFAHPHISEISQDSRGGKNRISKIASIKAFKIANLSHYGYKTKNTSLNCETAKIDLFVSETNLYKNGKYFKDNFSWYEKDVYILPFVPKARFISTKKFQIRKNKALVVGSITFDMVDDEFTKFFGHNNLQQQRQLLYNNKAILKPYTDSIVEKMVLATDDTLANHTRPTIIMKYLHSIRRKFIVIVKLFRYLKNVYYKIADNNYIQQIEGQNKKYYNLNIVDKLNDYKMFICPEEVIDLPGIGFVEGMSCGAAYIGVRHPMYSDLGLIERVHYIGYDGSISDLIRIVKYYQISDKKLEEIAENGKAYVAKHFSQNVVCENFMTFISGTMNVRLNS